MSTAAVLEKSIRAGSGINLPALNQGFDLPVVVIATSMNRTMRALEKADQLARPLGTGIEILVVETVPYALPLDEPPVRLGFVVGRLEEMAARIPEQTKITAYTCRDRVEAVKRVLNPHCPVVIGVRKRWWPTHDKWLVRKLRRAGFNVNLVETE
jgi:hypothetical protein